ncbi:MAG TPA: hypothetical protein VHR43_12240 [Gemmatimonadales bacterium]|jgi:hypothetical protein|nr:hypothetical protein [Gemmatimonadales bacterium]
MPRPTPFDLVFARTAGTVFPAVRAVLARDGHDPGDRDAFLMVPEVVSLLHDLRPEEGLGEGMDQLVALVHHAYLLWDAGALTLPLSPDRLTHLLESPMAPAAESDQPPRAYYAQLQDRQVWAQVVNDLPAEPMDGCFVHTRGGELRVLGIFGLRPEREGFSAVETSGPRPTGLQRPDGTALFSPVLSGGRSAGLYSLVGGEELLELGWRTRALANTLSAPLR